MFGRVGGTKSCQHEANAGAGDKTSNLQVIPPDAKPVLAVVILIFRMLNCSILKGQKVSCY